MKRTVLVMGLILSIFTIASCLDNEDLDFVPTVAETNNNNYYSRDGEGDNDTIPTDSTDNPKPPTGGSQGQNPIKP